VDRARSDVPWWKVSLTKNPPSKRLGAVGRHYRPSLDSTEGIGGQLIRSGWTEDDDNGADGNVACRSRLGGMLNYYYRRPA